MSVRRSCIEGQRDILVGAGRRDRKMACTFFEIDVQIGEATMQATSAVKRHRRVAGGSEERMGEADPVAVELEDRSRLGKLDVVQRQRPRAAPTA